MSTRDGYGVFRAVVHTVDSVTGVCHVQIPILFGRTLVPVSPVGLAGAPGAYDVPAIGDERTVLVEPDRTSVYWVVTNSVGVVSGDVDGGGFGT